jgi:hypothetical protein
MTVRLAPSGEIELVGGCPIDDAEPLLGLLLAYTDAPIDWRRCEHAHTAVVQVLLASGRPVLGPPDDPLLRRWVEPLLAKL